MAADPPERKRLRAAVRLRAEALCPAAAGLCPGIAPAQEPRYYCKRPSARHLHRLRLLEA